MPKFRRREFLGASGALLAFPLASLAQQARLYRIGVIHPGGLYVTVVDGLREGLKNEGFAEGKHFVFHVREVAGDLRGAAPAARSLEGEKVDLICSVTTSITTLIKQAKVSVPTVFYVGQDPVTAGLVEQFRRPGGRFTGVYSRNTDVLGAKRLQLLTQLAPKTRRVLLFSNPDNAVSQRSLSSIRAAAQKLKLEVVEQHARSVDEFRSLLSAFRPVEGDAIGYLTDALFISQAQFVAETGLAKKVPTIFSDVSVVAKGGLSSYGESYYKAGLRMAPIAHRVLLGANPGELPIEQLSDMHFAINLKTAKAIGLSIPPSMLQGADEVFR